MLRSSVLVSRRIGTHPTYCVSSCAHSRINIKVAGKEACSPLHQQSGGQGWWVIPSFYEFFAGGGMARAGLGKGWECLFANDFDHDKSAIYRRNWRETGLLTADVRDVKPETLPGSANLVWGSFPCQDLSLAGAGAGLKGNRSGTFWPFWDIVKGLIADSRAPEIIALENVVGTLHSHDGKDFKAICSAFQKIGYRFGAMVIDAALFVPQSRPRLFIIGMRDDLCVPSHVGGQAPSQRWHSRSLLEAHVNLPSKVRRNWIWWDMPAPPKRASVFADLIEDRPFGVQWHTAEETQRLLRMMSDVNRAKVDVARNFARTKGTRLVGAVYKRTRHDKNGAKVQRAEVRFDDVAGCLRTPAGGSSRQLILLVDRFKVRSRLISCREIARLMGLPENYVLPENYNKAYHLIGDGVVVPVVRYIAQNIFEPLIAAPAELARVAA